MRCKFLSWPLLCILTCGVIIGLAGTAMAGPMLKMAFIEVDSRAEVKKLARMGIDIAAVRQISDTPQRYRVEAVVSTRDQKKLQREGFVWNLAAQPGTDNLMARSQTKAAAESVYHSFDEPDLGIQDQLVQMATDYPDLINMESIGVSIQQRPILALCLTSKGHGKSLKHNRCKKPEVLFLATHHAREWVATQMAMRLIKYFVQNYGSDDRVTQLLDTTKIWIVPVANPDGYQYTFDVERLWRKNLRDNDGNGEINIADGVDLNRNFESHWGQDDEGSSPVWSDATYRGAAPHSEPETQVVADFVLAHNFKFIVSYHTYSNLILYPWGWQVQTPSLDDPIFVAQAGTDDNPAIYDSIMGQGYDPGVGADLYTTNGDFTDWTYTRARVPSYTVELTLGVDAEGNAYAFEFPDDEAMVQTVFEDNLEFALSLAESAADPAHPVSPVGIEVQDAYHEPLTVSQGSSQVIDVLARTKSRRHMWIAYRINNGRYGWNRFKPMLGNDYNDQPGVYFSRYQAQVKNQEEGDTVQYWIIGPGTSIGPYTYSVTQATDNSVLVLSAEDYTGEYPEYPDPSGPNYLSYYTEALDTTGIGYDVWDVTAQNGAPPYREVLSNYATVIWYTGDDRAATVPGVDVHEQIVLNLREFMNYSNGTLMASGQDLIAPAVRFGLLSDDYFQYNLGAFLTVEGGGMDTGSGEPFAVKGEDGDPIFDGLSFNLSGDDSANNQFDADTFLATSYFLPHFDNTVAARYLRPGGPFEPHGGSYYVYSQMADQAYKRLGGTFSLPASAPELNFWISYDIEAEWDFAFVEIREVGSDNWTTLPELNGLTDQSTGESCTSGWVDEIHPALANYMDGDCNPTGTTGDWHAFTGSSNGWRQVQFDLSAYAGQDVEIYISYATDWGTQNLGVFVDDITISGYDTEGFEVDLGEFEITTTEGNFPFNNWVRMEGGGFAEGPVIRTPNSVFLGFGFEAIEGNETRSEIMGRMMDYLLFQD